MTNGAHFSSTLADTDPQWVDGRTFIIRHGFRFYLTGEWTGEFVDVPDGFSTNFASTPRITWPLFPPAGAYAQIAVVHDKLFLAPVIRSAHSARPCTRHEANQIFALGAEVLGVSSLVRGIMFRALEIGSGASWDAYRKTDAAATWPPRTSTQPAALLLFENDRCNARACGLA